MRRFALLVLLAATVQGCFHETADDGGETAGADHHLTSATQPPPGGETTPAQGDPGPNGEDPASDDTVPADDTKPGDDPKAPADPDPGPLSKTYQHFDVNHVIITGQSNSVANGGTQYLTNEQPESNLMFDTGVMPITSCTNGGCLTYQTPSSFVPLVEGDRFFDYQVETSSSGLANQVSHLAKARHGFGGAGAPAKENVFVSVSGRSGNTLWCIGKGGCPYQSPAIVRSFDQAMMDVQHAKQIAAASNLSYVVRGVALVHGESDHYGYSAGTPEFPRGGLNDYADGLIELQRDYDASVRGLTAQAQPVPLFVSQIAGWTDVPVSKIAVMQLDAHKRAPGKVVLVAPSYMLQMQTDCLHFNNHGYRRLGEYFAKAYARVVFENKPWEPLRPEQITRNGNVITVKYLVPKPPLAFDTTRVTDSGHYGFTFADDAATTISSVALAGADTVKITLSGPPGGNARLRYALNQVANTCIGPGTQFAGGARGNLRDSDDAPSRYGYDLQNWGVAFDEAVP